jgi:hypothetical protein
MGTGHQDVEARLAAQLVRRMCCQHDCKGDRCIDLHHRRDENLVEDHLAMLGLKGELPPVSSEERHEWFEEYAKAPVRDIDLEQLVV